MATRKFVHVMAHEGLRVLAILVLLASMAGFGVRPARAYDWCSVDPVFAFQQKDSLTAFGLDVQVMVPLSALPLADPATLDVGVPADLTGQEVLNTSTPAFELRTTLSTVGNRTSSLGDPIEFEVVVPSSAGDIPVRLVVTDTRYGTITISEGESGHKVRASVEVSP